MAHEQAVPVQLQGVWGPNRMQCKLVIGIPTIGRASILCEVLPEFARQTRQADRIIVCGTQPCDVEGVADVFPDAEILLSNPGLPKQRNAILAAASDADIVVFFDDDFLPDPHYLHEIERQMVCDEKIAVATGHVLADGIIGPGLLVRDGQLVLERAEITPNEVTPVFNGYGCNMAVRASLMRANDVMFDERLPLYGWQEDVDLSRRLAAFGTIVKVPAARGVHLGVKLGRNSGVRLGYSQIANPLYLSFKRRGYPLSWALKHMTRNVAMNVVRCLWPEPYVDRYGRLRGNMLALRDLVIGQMVPERILRL